MMGEAQPVAAPTEPNMDQMIDAAVEEAPQALLACGDAQLGQADAVLAAIQGPAIRAVLGARVDQIVRHGHDADSDAMLPIGWLPRRAIEMMQGALDMIDATRERRNLKIGRARMAKAAAIAMAAIDRLDAISGAEIPE